MALLDCLAKCAQGDSTCVNSCASAHQSGVAVYNALGQCFDASCSTCTGAGGSGGSSGSGGSAGSAGSGGTFMTAPHEPFLIVPDNGGRKLAHPKVVTVTFPGYAYRTQVEGMGDWIVGSSWLTTVGADYGVGSGEHLAKVALQEPAPSSIADSQIGAFLDSHIASGALPAPTDPDTIYMLYFPSSTTVSFDTSQGGGTSCVDFGGYHSSWFHDGTPTAYAVIPGCPAQGTELQSIEIAMAHELIEAATDADPLISTPGWSTSSSNASLSGWVFFGSEVADLCDHEQFQDASGYTVQSVWSNARAAQGNVDPCVPAKGPSPYYNVSPEQNGFKVASPGQTVTFTLTGWSEAPVADWYLQAKSYSGSFDAGPTLAASKLNNGKTTTLTLKVPPTAQSGEYAVVVLLSYTSQQSFSMFPVAVYVQ